MKKKKRKVENKMRDDDFGFSWGRIGFGLFAILAVVALFGLWRSCTVIRPGFVGVSIRKCGDAQVSKEPIGTGYYFRNLFCEDIVEYPTSLRTIVLTNQEGEGDPNLDQAITITSSESLAVDIDVALSFTVDPKKAPAIYEKFRAGVDQIAITFMRQTIREALRQSSVKYTAEQLNSEKQEEMRAEAQEILTVMLGKEGFIVQQFTIGKVHVPPQVVNAINAKVAMTQEAQRADAEVKKKKAEADQAVAIAKGEADAAREKARGDADAITIRAEAQARANKILSESVTPQLIEYERAKKWNGQLPSVTGGAIPYINVK